MLEVRPEQIAAYLRLSREDLRAPGGMEEKWEDRKAICRRLAVTNNLPLSEDAMHCEQESGSTIDERPIFLELLSRIRSGRIRVLITPYQDRLARPDLADLDRIEKAFLRHSATLICSEYPHGLTFDANYRAHGGVLFGVQAVMSRGRLGSDSLKRTQTNISKVRRNHRTSGFAIYGYQALRAPTDTSGQVISPTQADVDAGLAIDTPTGLRWRSYRTVPNEYAVLCEMCRRALAGEACYAIALDLNRRGIPAPGRRNEPGGPWCASTVKELVRNPFVAGRLARRNEMTPDGRHKRLKPSEYVIADVDGDWEHPLTMEEYHQIVAHINGHRYPDNGRTGLLTGILYCAMGGRMVLSGPNYACKCADKGTPHAGVRIFSPRLEQWVGEIIQAVLAIIPEADFTPKKRRGADRSVLLADLSAARATEEKATRALDNLLSDPEAFAGILAEKGYADALKRAEAQRADAIARRQSLESELARPDLASAIPLLRQVRQDFPAFWQHATPTERRRIVQLIIERIDLAPVPPNRRYIRNAHVKLWDVYADLPAPNLPPFPKPRCGFVNETR